jgi:flagellar basal body L-ring protein FlgH
VVGNDDDHHDVVDDEMVMHNDLDDDEVVEEEDKNIHCFPDDDLVDKMTANVAAAAVDVDDNGTLTVEGDQLSSGTDDEVVDEDDPSDCPYP